MRLLIAVQVQVAHAVAGGTGTHNGSSASSVRVAHAAAGASLGAGVRRNGAGEVVGLGRKEQVPVPGLRLQLAGFTRLSGEERGHFESFDSGGVVFEGDDGVVGVRLPRRFDNAEERFADGLTVDDQVAAEEPVAGVLTVGLGNIEELDVGGVAFHLIAEQLGIVIEIPLVEGQTHLLVDLLERRTATCHDRDREDGLGFARCLEGVDGLGVDLFSHAVMDERGEGGELLMSEGALAGEEVATTLLQTSDLAAETDGLADADGVGGEGGGEGHTRAHLEDVAIGGAASSGGSRQLRGGGQELGLEGLAKQPSKRLGLLSTESSSGGDVETLFAINGNNSIGNLLVNLAEKGTGSRMS
mmetsp:Transcript_4465/g.7984  ORF Transcript_4465/g.7984 Transcript_4465/m.7984 type:complete len:357 (+) Transcript_4465:2861-3931(+)